MIGSHGALRPEGSPCPACGSPIERRASSADPGEVLMRCRRCGWTGSWRRHGSRPVDGTPAQAAEDLAWSMGREAPRGRPGEIIEFRGRG